MAECETCETNDDSCRHYHKMRRVRDGLLRDSDKYVFPDIWELYTDIQKEEVREYRQALRDWPETVNNPMDLVDKLPPKPSFVINADTYNMS